MTKQKKKFIYISIFILILISIFFYYFKYLSLPTYDQEHIKEVEKEFNKLLEEYGEKIELEKMDTTDWKTYEDHERRFSFQYPPDWHVVPVDVTKRDLMEEYSFKSQNDIEKYDDHDNIRLQPKGFLSICLINGEEAYNRFQMSDDYKYVNCNISFSKKVATYKKEKRSPAEIYLDFQKHNLDYYGKINSKYIISDDIYIYSGNINILHAGFILDDGSIVEVRNKNQSELLNYPNNTVFGTLIQTIKKVDKSKK